MANKLNLSASLRDISSSPAQSRREGLIPAVVYGHGFTNTHLLLPYTAFEKIYRTAGSSTIISLTLDKENFDVLIHEVDRDPVSDLYTHVDFLRIKQDQEITAEIPLEIMGESPAVKNFGGILLHTLDSIEVRCLPKYLVSSIAIDISGMEEIHSSIHVKDLKISKDIEVLNDPEQIIVSVAAPAKEEVVEEGAVQLIPDSAKEPVEPETSNEKEK